MKASYYVHLNALRAIAVMGPVFLHLWPKNVPDTPLTERVTGIGFLGVELFFVISGFLITGILLNARDEAHSVQESRVIVLRAFYIRRVLRIFPIYWGVLLVSLALSIGPVREHFWWLWLYGTNFRIANLESWIGVHSHFWSLAVEEQFYIFWPLLILFTPKKYLLIAVGLVIALAPAFRWYATEYLSPFNAVVLMPACLDVLGLGAMLAMLRRERDQYPARFEAFLRGAWVLGAIGSLYFIVDYLNASTGWVTNSPLARTAYALLFVGIVNSAATGFQGKWKRVADLRMVLGLGAVSYSVYLFHPLIGWPLMRIPGTAVLYDWPVIMFIVLVILTFLAATVSWHLFEKPINGLRRYFPYVDNRPAELRH